MKKVYFSILLLLTSFHIVFANYSDENSSWWYFFTNSSWEQLIIQTTSDLVQIKTITDIVNETPKDSNSSSIINTWIELLNSVDKELDYFSWINNLSQIAKDRIIKLNDKLDADKKQLLQKSLIYHNNRIILLQNQYLIALNKMYKNKNTKKLITKSEKIITILPQYIKENKKLSHKNTQLLNWIISYTKFKLIEIKSMSDNDIIAMLFK